MSARAGARGTRAAQEGRGRRQEGRGRRKRDEGGASGTRAAQAGRGRRKRDEGGVKRDEGGASGTRAASRDEGGASAPSHHPHHPRPYISRPRPSRLCVSEPLEKRNGRSALGDEGGASAPTSACSRGHVGARALAPSSSPMPQYIIHQTYIVINSELSYTTRNTYILHQKRGRIVHLARTICAIYDQHTR
jgi:hypothetical protein